MSLIRCSDHWERVQQTKAPSFVLIRAAAILDRLLKDSSHNYEALLLLVRLYLLVGAGSLAFKTFSKLSVKHIQNETVGHNLFTRIDTIHPHRAPPPETEDEDNIPDTDYRNFSPDVALDQALSFYRHANTTANRQRNSGLQLGSYINVEGTIELQKRLNASICRKMWAAESNRIERLIGDDVVEGHADLGRMETLRFQ
jgi:N-terminal acetyltransferase B complex non-catalytic subunit